MKKNFVAVRVDWKENWKELKRCLKSEIKLSARMMRDLPLVDCRRMEVELETVRWVLDEMKNIEKIGHCL